MPRQGRPLSFVLLLVLAGGCSTLERRGSSAPADRAVGRARLAGVAAASEAGVALPGSGAALPLEPASLDGYIARALAEDRTVQAAYHNVESLKYRIPQVTALDDPIASNTIFAIPSVAPQYSLMGYNPYNLTLAQQFPWFGTLRLRGEIADRDVRVAVAELAAAQLDAVAAVRRAYFDLHAAERTAAILAENRKILVEFRDFAKTRLTTGGSQQDLLRAETLMSELDRVVLGNQQDAASARSALARRIHARPDASIRTLPNLPIAKAPVEIERLYELALSARPELRGRLEAIARDEKAIELARKRFYPNITLGLSYMDMTKTNAVAPITASGSPNIGLFVAFNLPIHRNKYRAGVCEARERALADAKLYEAERDEAESEIQDYFTQAKVQENVLGLLRDIRGRAEETLQLARTDYEHARIDIASLLSAEREILQADIQIAQVEAELGKAIANLERAVGLQINERTLERPAGAAAEEPAGPSREPDASPFRPAEADANTPSPRP